MTHASVFSGIGGPEVAATMLGWENLFHCEINPFGRQVLDYWYPNSKSYEDITKTDFREWRGRVNVLTGGFPCQPFSCAGKRRGAEDDRYLWPHMHRCINEIQPDWFVGENVAGILTMVEQGDVSKVASQAALFDEGDTIHGYQYRATFTLERICRDVEADGYEVFPILIPACAVGAPHRRDRVFIIGRRIDADTAGRGSSPQGTDAEGTRQRAEILSGQTGRGERHAPVGNHGLSSVQGAATDTRSCGQSASELESERERTEVQQQSREQSQHGTERFGISRNAPDTDGNRGLQVHEHLESEIADGAEPFGNGWQWDVADTESERAGRLRIEGEEERSRMRHVVFGNGCRLRRTPDEIGSRWRIFPSVAPIHRGNDGLPFDVDDLTISFPKWRNESVKAYGNAIVPQVMYEIFRAIEQVENQENRRNETGRF